MMKVFLLLATLLLTSVTAQSSTTEGPVCQAISKVIDSANVCSMTACSNSAVIFGCNVTFFDQHIGVEVTAHLCANPVNLEIAFSLDGNTIFTQTVSSNIVFPVPGLSVSVPDVGSAGVFADVDIGLSDDDVSIALSLQACASIPIVGKKCFPDPGFQVFDLNIPINGLCN